MRLRICVLIAALTVPSLSSAAPVTYEIDYTLLSSSTLYGPKLPGAPLQTIFTFDDETELFSGLAMVWPSSTWNIYADFLGGNLVGYNLNNFTMRHDILDNLLDGGVWEMGTTTMGIDAWASLDGYGFYVLSQGNNDGDRASGTFTTTLVPEPSTGVLTLIGVAVAWIRRKSITVGGSRPCSAAADRHSP